MAASTGLMRLVGEGALAGIVAGLVVGVAARVAMRLVALGVPDGIQQVPAFTWEGTAFVLFLGGLAGAPFGALAAWIRPLRRVSAAWRGVAIGMLLLAGVGPLFFGSQAGEFVSPGRLLLFAPLFLVFGVVVALALAALARSSRALPARGLLLAAALAAGGAAFVVTGTAEAARHIADSLGVSSAAALVAPLVALVAGAVLTPDSRRGPGGDPSP